MMATLQGPLTPEQEREIIKMVEDFDPFVDSAFVANRWLLTPRPLKIIKLRHDDT